MPDCATPRCAVVATLALHAVLIATWRGAAPPPLLAAAGDDAVLGGSVSHVGVELARLPRSAFAASAPTAPLPPPADRAELLSRCVPLLMAPAIPPPPPRAKYASPVRSAPFDAATAQHDQRCHYAGEPRAGSRFAIFTYVQHEHQCVGDGYGEGAEVLGYSLQKFMRLRPNVPRFAMLWGGEFALDRLDESACVARLRRAGWTPCVAPPIEPPHVMEAGKVEFRQQFIKFALFNMVEFESVLYIDADVTAFGDISPVFDIALNATAMMGASLDTSDDLNCGMMLLKTGRDVFTAAYDAAMGDTVPFNHRMSEQGFLRAYTAPGAHGHSWVRFPPSIGANLWRYQHDRDWWTRVERRLGGMRAVHFTTFKPWNCRAAKGCNATLDADGTGPLVERWWALHAEFEAQQQQQAAAAAAAAAATAPPPPPLRDGPLSLAHPFELATAEQPWRLVFERLDAVCALAPRDSACGRDVSGALADAARSGGDPRYSGVGRHPDAAAMQQYLYEVGRACPRPCRGVGERDGETMTRKQIARAEGAGCAELVRHYGLQRSESSKDS